MTTLTAEPTTSETLAQLDQQVQALQQRKADLERAIAQNWSGDTRAEAAELAAIPGRLAAAALIRDGLAAQSADVQRADALALAREQMGIVRDMIQQQKALEDEGNRLLKLAHAAAEQAQRMNSEITVARNRRAKAITAAQAAGVSYDVIKALGVEFTT